MNVVTGVFDSMEHAEMAVRELMEMRFDADDIGVYTQHRDTGMRIAQDMGWEYTDPAGGHFTSSRHVFNCVPESYVDTIDRSNLGHDATKWYQDRLEEGRILVTVITGDRVDDAVNVVHKHHGWLYNEQRTQPRATGEMPTREGEVRVPIVDEEVIIEKRRHQIGEVTVRPERRQETVEFPTSVMHEEIRVERRKLDRPLSPDEYQGMDRPQGEMRMPIVEEEITVTKRPVIREEMVVTRMPVTETKTVHETVTHEEPRVQTTGEVEVEGMTEEERRRRRPAA